MNDVIIGSPSLNVARPQIWSLDALAFRIFKLRDEGSQHFVEEAENVEDAREQAGLWPGEYIIQNEETGERVVITSNGGWRACSLIRTNSETCLSMLPVADDLPQLQL